MAITCQSIAERAASKLQDLDWVTYTEPKFVNALNAACRAIAVLHSDASVVTEVVTLVAGTRHSIPAAGIAFRNANRNFSDATTPGRAVQLKRISDKNRIDPYWQTNPAEAEVVEVMPDENDPTVFWTYPPIEAGTRLEIVYTGMPGTLTLDDNLPFPDKFIEPVFHWVLYELYNEDSTSVEHSNKAREEKGTAMELLGLSTQSKPEVMP